MTSAFHDHASRAAFMTGALAAGTGRRVSGTPRPEGNLGRIDLAVFALRILGIECQHRALYRVISADDPADNVTLEVADFDCVGDAATVLKPFLTGHGFPVRAGPAIPIPTPAETALVIGKTISD